MASSFLFPAFVMAPFHSLRGILGRAMVWLISRPSRAYHPFSPSDPQAMRRVLRPGDVLLVEGNQKVSTVIKYMTQSTWSHAAMFVGDISATPGGGGEMLVEVDLMQGCVAAPLSKYDRFTTRICRPVGLTDEDRDKVVKFMTGHIGLRYDMRNVFDLARYLHPLPFVPARWRRRMIALGGGEPTRAICSTLIAEAFQAISYPILPPIDVGPDRVDGPGAHARREIQHIRHYSLYAPRDFDMSPFFQIVKPMIDDGFDYRVFVWDI